MEDTMKRVCWFFFLALFLAGCSGRAAFESEILGAPPESPPPPTAAGPNVYRQPEGRNLGASQEPAPAAGATSPRPSVSTTAGDVAPAHTPAPYQSAPYQSAPAYQAQAPQATPQTAPVAQSAQTQSPYAQAGQPQAQTHAQAQGYAPAQVQAGQGAPLNFLVGTFAHETNAVSLRDMLVARGHQSSVDQGQTAQGKVFYRVYARMSGSEAEARAALAALGVSEPTLVTEDGRRITQKSPAAPAKTPAAQTPAAVQTSAAAQTPAAAPAAAAPAAAGAAPSVISGPTGKCQVDAARISATGAGRADAGEPLMAQKAAAQNAKRNLLLCIDAYKRKAEKIPNSIKMEGYLPDTLVSYTSPAYLSDGSVEIGASIAVGDVDAVAFTRLE
jgi:hypothetical protein